MKQAETTVQDVARAVSDVADRRDVPFFSSRPAAGFPAPGDDQVERVLDINDLVVQHPESTFFVRVEGDSMVDVGIFSGDVLVVDRSPEPRDGSIVVAAVNGEMVVKQLVIRSGRRELHSANSNYNPILLGEDEECYIWGTVVGSVRTF